MPGIRSASSAAKIGAPKKLMIAWPPMVAAAPPQLPVKNSQIAAPVEVVADARSPATPMAARLMFISFCPIDINPPKGSDQIWAWGRRKPAIVWKAAFVRFSLLKICSSTFGPLRVAFCVSQGVRRAVRRPGGIRRLHDRVERGHELRRRGLKGRKVDAQALRNAIIGR